MAMGLQTKELKDVVVWKYTLDYEKYKQTVEVLKAEDTLTAIKILYTVANDSKLKVTKKRTLAVRSYNLLEKQMPQGYAFAWLINMSVEHKYLQNGQLLLPTQKFHKLIEKSDGEIVKNIFQNILDSPWNHEIANALFRASITRGEGVKNFRKVIVKLIKQQDASLWVSIDSLVDQIKLDNQTLKDITNGYRYCYAFYGKSKKIQYNKIEYLKVVVRYFLKTFFGNMCQIGLCDLGVTEFQAYNKEDVPILQGAVEADTRFGHIEFYKLTTLGRYALGIETHFESGDEYRLLLNDYNLELKVQNGNNLLDIFLKRIATKIDETKYVVDTKSFMKNIDTLQSYRQVKKSFLDKTGDLPQNWKSFFEILDKRAKSISVVSRGAVVLKVQNSKDIVEILSSNKRLQKKILKADKMHIVVMQEDFSTVKNILKEYGVLVS